MANKKDQPSPADQPQSPTESSEHLAAENAQLREELAATKASLADSAFTANDQQCVDLKVAAGLDRDQAVAVVKAQKEHDRQLAAAQSKGGKG